MRLLAHLVVQRLQKQVFSALVLNFGEQLLQLPLLLAVAAVRCCLGVHFQCFADELADTRHYVIVTRLTDRDARTLKQRRKHQLCPQAQSINLDLSCVDLMYDRFTSEAKLCFIAASSCFNHPYGPAYP